MSWIAYKPIRKSLLTFMILHAQFGLLEEWLIN
jgi:hypothetical protein